MGSFLHVPVTLPAGVSSVTCSFRYVVFPGRLSKKEAERLAFSEQLPWQDASTIARDSSFIVEYDYDFIQSQFAHFTLSGAAAALTVLTFVSDAAPYMQGKDVASSFVFCVRPTKIVSAQKKEEKKPRLFAKKSPQVTLTSFDIDPPAVADSAQPRFSFVGHLNVEGALDAVSHVFVYVFVGKKKRKFLRLRQQLSLADLDLRSYGSFSSGNFSFTYTPGKDDPDQVEIVLRLFDASFSPLAERSAVVTLPAVQEAASVGDALLSDKLSLHILPPSLSLAPPPVVSFTAGQSVIVPLELFVHGLLPVGASCFLYRRVDSVQRDLVTLFSAQQPLLPSMMDETTTGITLTYPYSFIAQADDEHSEIEIRLFDADHNSLASTMTSLTLTPAVVSSVAPSFTLRVQPSKLFFSSSQEEARVLYETMGVVPADAHLELSFVGPEESSFSSSFPLPRGEIAFTRSSLLAGAVRAVRLVPYEGDFPLMDQSVTLPVVISPFISSVALSFVDPEDDSLLPFWTKDVIVGETLECAVFLQGDVSSIVSLALSLDSMTYPFSSDFTSPCRFTLTSSSVGAQQLRVVAQLVSGASLDYTLPLFVHDLEQDPSTLVSSFTGPERVFVGESLDYSVQSSAQTPLYFAAVPLTVSEGHLSLPADLSGQLLAAELKGEVVHNHAFTLSFASAGAYLLALYVRLQGTVRVVTQKIVQVTTRLLDYSLLVPASAQVGQEVVARVTSSGAAVPLILWSVNFIGGADPVTSLTDQDAAAGTATFVFPAEFDHLRVWIFAQLYDAQTSDFIQLLSRSIDVGSVALPTTSRIDGPDEAIVGQPYSFRLTDQTPPLAACTKLLLFSLENSSLPSQRVHLRPALRAGATFTFTPTLSGHCVLALLADRADGDLETIARKDILVHPSLPLLGSLTVEANPHLIHFSESSTVSVAAEPGTDLHFSWYVGTPEGSHEPLDVTGSSFVFTPIALAEDQDSALYSLYAEAADAQGTVLGTSPVLSIEVIRQHPQAYFARQHLAAQREILLQIRDILQEVPDDQPLSTLVADALDTLRRALRAREHSLVTLVADWPSRLAVPIVPSALPLEYSAQHLFGDAFRDSYLKTLFARIKKQHYVGALSFLLKRILGFSTDDTNSFFWKRYRFVEHYEQEFLKSLTNPSVLSESPVSS